MRFQILSHAGSCVEGDGIQLLTDPWLVGSTYWRSWWNYPPVERSVLDRLAPTHIYLTHVHWDHFQGASLRRFPKTTPILAPRGPYDRIARDLRGMGFSNVVEIQHGQTMSLAPDFKVTSYHFGPFLDSALVIESGGRVILNANDAKLMGRPLQKLVERHPRIDFVLRSHSSANGRLCYDIVDDPVARLDDMESYIASFAAFVRATGARYAVPFASNHCFLHKETFDLNHTIQTPLMVEDYFRRNQIRKPELKVMLSGDSWSEEDGFAISAEAREKYFGRRNEALEQYRSDRSAILEKFYGQEARAKVSLEAVQRYFAKFHAALPMPVRRFFKGHPIRFVLSAGERHSVFEVDLCAGTAREIGPHDPPADELIEVHTSALIMKQCMALDMFSHVSISKRVRYRVTTATKKYVSAMNFLFNLYEYDYLPIGKALSRRAAENWWHRRDEIGLYGQIAFDLLRGKGIRQLDYLAAVTRRAEQRELA